MNEWFGWLFSSPGFMPHGHCYLWQPGTLWLNVGSDGLIAVAYFAIPFTLYHFVRRRRSEIPFPWLLLMFAAFIFLCGSTHVMEIWTVWNPDYRLGGALKLLTAVASLATSAALFWLVPRAMQLRTPNELSWEVEKRTADLADANARLTKEIAARDLAHAQLRELDRRKDEFLATLAHELRNPLAPILHAVKLLGPESDHERQRWGRDVISRQVKRMGLLLDDLLDVSRVTRGRLELKKEVVPLRSVVNSALEVAAPLIEQKGHALEVSLPSDAIDVDVDPLRLSQALSNLLTNAAKFTPAGGRIEVVASLNQEYLDISVGDNGAGFDPEATARLFEMFSQAQTGLEGADGGLGIGLALVKGLMELHGGTVSAYSAGPSQGARFTLRLPRTVLANRSATPAPLPFHVPGAAPRGRVLIADDNRDAADTLGLILEADGYEVAVAYSGGQALQMAQQQRPDVLVLDIGMPGMSGYELAQTIRKEPWGASVLMLAITGWGQPDDKKRALAAGFDRHMTKPVHPAEIEELLGAFLSGRKGAI